MTGSERTFRPGGQAQPAMAARTGTDVADLIAEIRRMAQGADPAEVGQVINDVLSALDRATGGQLSNQLAERAGESDLRPGPAGAVGESGGPTSTS